MKKFTIKDIINILDRRYNKLHLSDVIVQACSTCKGHKLLLNGIGFPITCYRCNGSGNKEPECCTLHSVMCSCDGCGKKFE